MFVGIDPSLTGTGLILLAEDATIIIANKFSTPAMGVERLYHLENKLLEFLDSYKDIKLVCIEGGAYRETGRIFDLGEWSGVLKLNLYKKGIPVIPAAPLQLKKFVSGVGINQGKEVIILDVFKNFKEEIRDADIADAYVLARMARAYHYLFISKKYIKLKKYQLEVLKKIHEEHTGTIKKLI